jgi:RNA-splicing ligase RtcB
MEKRKYTGKDLISMGFEPGEWFKEALMNLNENDYSDSEVVTYLKSIQPAPHIPIHEKPVEYFKNISSMNELEEINVSSVFRTMDELMRTPTIVAGAIMPDACPTGRVGEIPVGGVAVAHNAIHPGMHSADICCSVMVSDLGKTDPKDVLNNAQNVSHFGPKFSKEEIQHSLPDHLLDGIENNHFLNNDSTKLLSRLHLGTQGDGNHFLYVGISKKSGNTFLVTHHGSRGVGAVLYKNAMKVAEKFRKRISKETLPNNAWIPYDTDEGRNYWKALQTVRNWTKYNHNLIHKLTAERVGVSIIDNYWNEHNFVFKEGDLFYHAKGSTPVDTKFLPDTNGLQIIPLNMAQPILIVKGKTNETNLGFAPHGAGRNVSRSKHKYMNSEQTDREIFENETKDIDARFYSGHIDISELPSAYKDAETVRKQIETFNLCEIEDEILPYGSIMAGNWQIDAPWNKKKSKK